MPRPPKPVGETCIRMQISFRGDQAEKLRALRKQKRLSSICQAAVDGALVGL